MVDSIFEIVCLMGCESPVPEEGAPEAPLCPLAPEGVPDVPPASSTT